MSSPRATRVLATSPMLPGLSGLANGAQTRDSLAGDIWRACDILRRDNNCGGVMEYVEHLAWLLFLRFLDAQESIWAQEAELDNKTYTRILDGKLRWDYWGRRDWDAEELIKFIHGTLLPSLQALSGDPLRDTIRSIFSERTVIVAASGYNLKDVLAIIDEIDFTSQDDIFTVSHVYEDLLRKLGNENKMAGEFYTPRPVIRFIVDLVAPQLDEMIYDPATGSSGFLAQAFEYLRRSNASLTIAQNECLQTQTFFGNEKKAVPALLGLMNLALHGVTAPKQRRGNTLEEDVKSAPAERFDVIITNPPFGGTENRQIQENFTVPSNATELLFLQHIMKKLKPKAGARCGMVMPEGTLFRGGAFATVKKDLLEQFNLHTVISLPPGTFAPYSDVKTALLFFERPGPTQETWYYELPLPAGLKKFSKGNPIQDEHFAEARALWQAWNGYRKGRGAYPQVTANSWLVPAAEIKARGYDLTARNPNRAAVEQTRSAVEITAGLLERIRELNEIVEELHEQLGGGNGDAGNPVNGNPAHLAEDETTPPGC
ncbi:MAG: type I restriction-modification system subunit M [Chloroflexi bacterium]|nr:type I restriction-modification system subunit M [Chloroflexota bacterium]